MLTSENLAYKFADGLELKFPPINAKIGEKILITGCSGSGKSTFLNLIAGAIKLQTGKLIFDGYPRTINQAENLNNLLAKSNQKINFVFFLNVEKETIIKRIKKRKILEKRSDDDFKTILKRYDTYMEVTKPVLEYYSKKNNFHEVDGSMEIINISQKIEEILNV